MDSGDEHKGTPLYHEVVEGNDTAADYEAAKLLYSWHRSLSIIMHVER